MICGTFGTYDLHLHYIDQVIGRRAGVENYYAMNLLMLPKRTVFICDTYVNPDPTPEQSTEMTVLAAEEIRRFGLVPKAALLSHSSFGSSNAPSAFKMRAALAMIRERLRRTSRSKARCMATRRFLPKCGWPASRTRGCKAMPTC